MRDDRFCAGRPGLADRCVTARAGYSPQATDAARIRGSWPSGRHVPCTGAVPVTVDHDGRERAVNSRPGVASDPRATPVRWSSGWSNDALTATPQADGERAPATGCNGEGLWIDGPVGLEICRLDRVAVNVKHGVVRGRADLRATSEEPR
jgi:hypothetical protein